MSNMAVSLKNRLASEASSQSIMRDEIKRLRSRLRKTRHELEGAHEIALRLFDIIENCTEYPIHEQRYDAERALIESWRKR